MCSARSSSWAARSCGRGAAPWLRWPLLAVCAGVTFAILYLYGLLLFASLVKAFGEREGARIGDAFSATIESADLVGESYDAIVCADVLEHLGDPAGALRRQPQRSDPVTAHG